MVTAAAVAAALIALVAVVVLLITGGGDDDDDVVAEPSRAITIEGDEYSFAPDPALGLAGEVEITLSNIGQIGHELVVLDAGVRITAPDQFDPAIEVARIDSIAGGTEASTTAELGAGTYQVVCLIGGHFESGMESDLIVS